MKHLFRNQIAVAILLAVTTSAMAQVPPILTKLRQSYNKQSTFKTAFDLQIYWKVRERTEEKSGVLYLAPGDKFRAEVGNTIWVSDGRTYWQYSAGTNQVVIKHLLDVDLSAHPSQIIEKYLIELPFSLTEEDDKQAVLHWQTSENEEKVFAKSVTVWIDKKKTTLKKLLVIDTNGNESTYTFKKTRLNADIPAEAFTLETPEGAHVLDTRE